VFVNCKKCCLEVKLPRRAKVTHPVANYDLFKHPNETIRTSNFYYQLDRKLRADMIDN